MKESLLIFILLFAQFSFSGNWHETSLDSHFYYSPLEGFKDIEGVDNGVWVYQGYLSYQVQISGSDLRYELGLIYKDKLISGFTHKRDTITEVAGDIFWYTETEGAESRANVKAMIFKSSWEPTPLIGGTAELTLVKIDGENSCTVGAYLFKSTEDLDKVKGLGSKVENMACLIDSSISDHNISEL